MRIYTVPFLSANLPATNAMDLWDIAPATNKPVALLGMSLDNVGIGADAGDAQEEMLPITIVRGLATVGSGGSSGTAMPVQENDTAASFTARVNDTTVAVVGGGATNNIAGLGWNVRVPLREFWPLEMCPTCSAAQTRIVVKITTAGADAVTISGTLWVAELL